jgi:hypothetical protein
MEEEVLCGSVVGVPQAIASASEDAPRRVAFAWSRRVQTGEGASEFEKYHFIVKISTR